jgi:polyphenol oxidase
MAIDFITPDWPAPANVGSAITLRRGGCSIAPFDQSNLALHVQDNPQHVQANRKNLMASLDLPTPPVWLDQYHSAELIDAAQQVSTNTRIAPRADGSFSDQPGTVCAVLTADCLPVLLCDKAGTQVAAAHAGWRGLSAGILRKTVATFKCPADHLMAYLGPAIGPQVFEVGAEVMELFLDNGQDADHCRAIDAAFSPQPASKDKFLADLYRLARAELSACGLTSIFGGGFCTYTDAQRFYSFRRESKTGRNATLIWLR